MLDYPVAQAPRNHIIVEVEELYDSTVKHGSLELHIDPYYKPTHYVRIYGKVIGLPKGKSYNEDGKEIVSEVQIGDKVYFHYLSTLNETNCIFRNIYKIPYYHVFCVVRDSRIIPIASWTLCEFINEDEPEFKKVEVEGVHIYAKEDSKTGLITEVFKKESTKLAVMQHIGTPLVGEPELSIPPGARVLIDRNTNFKNTIEGREYYTILQENILAKALN